MSKGYLLVFLHFLISPPLSCSSCISLWCLASRNCSGRLSLSRSLGLHDNAGLHAMLSFVDIFRWVSGLSSL